MALVTVQRSPSPSQSGADLDEGDASTCTEGSRVSGKPKRSRASSLVKRCINSMRFISRIRISESYFTVKGAALILPNAEACKRKASKAAHGGDIQNHLQAMCHLLRPQDTLQVAVRLESVYAYKRARYFAVVSCNGQQDTEESVVLGFDCQDHDTRAVTVGLVLPVWANTCTSMNGDGGFTVWTAIDRTANERTHIFNPVTVQAMWSGLHVLHKVCDNANACCYVPSGPTHTWISYYESKLALADPMAIGEWNMTDDLIAAMRSGEGNPACTPTVSEHEDIKKQIRPKLREIMIRMDLENVTSVYLREQLEAVFHRNLKEYKSFIDEEMIVVMGQLDSPSRIFDFLFLGSEWNASNLDELNRNGVGYILNVTKEIDNFFPGLFKYHNVRVYDTEDTDLLKYWEATYKFILRAVEANSKVLVHCKMGVSRSASTVIAFAMKQYNWSFEKAHDFVLARRSVVRPNDGFRHQLQLYEGILKASNQRHSDLWRSRSESNLKVQLRALSTMQLMRHGKCGAADERGNDNGKRSSTEDSGCREGSLAAKHRQSDAGSASGALRPRSWSSRSADKDQGVLMATKSTSCLMELDDSSVDEDGGENRSSSSSNSSDDDDDDDDDGNCRDTSESDDGNAFSNADDDSKLHCRRGQYDVTTDADLSANAVGSADVSVSAETSAESADPSVPTSLAVEAAAAAGRGAPPAVSRPSMVDVSLRPEVATAFSPAFASALDGSSAPGAGAPPARSLVSPARMTYPTADGLRVSSPSDSAGATNGFSTTVSAPSAAAGGVVLGWAPAAVKRQPRPADAVSANSGVVRTSPCRGGGGSRDSSPAKHAAAELPSSAARCSSEEPAAPVPADKACMMGGAARPSSLEWIWRQRYASEDIPWSPGAVRRQKDMLECLRARAGTGATVAAIATSATTPEVVGAGGIPASAVCTRCPETGMFAACGGIEADDPSSPAAVGVEGYQPAPGTVMKVRREFEERLIGDEGCGGASRSCTVQRSSSLRGLPQLPDGRWQPTPSAALQRSASVRERRSAGCLGQVAGSGISRLRPSSTTVPSPLPQMRSATTAASSSSGDLRQRASSGAFFGGGSSSGRSPAGAALPVERAASLSCLAACVLPTGVDVKLFLGSGRADSEWPQPSSVHARDPSGGVPEASKPKPAQAGSPDISLREAAHLATTASHPKTCHEPLLRHQAQQRPREGAAATSTALVQPVAVRTERGSLRRCGRSGCSPPAAACKRAHGASQHGNREPAQLKHASSVRNLVHVFEASRQNGNEEEEQSACSQRAFFLAASSPTKPASRSPGQTAPLFRTGSLCLPCRHTGSDQRSAAAASGGRLRSGHSFSRRSWIASSAVFPTT